jgi:putative intracellular protease/amidase
LTRAFDQSGKLIAMICHAGWIPISAGIMADLGGRLTARNVEGGHGAIFDINLPVLGKQQKAAE